MMTLLHLSGIGQDINSDANSFMPPSPTAYELGKYGSHPVSYYRGTTSINIPIYTLEAGSFQLPISLSYNSSGIKVEDIASWVGLGWSLNAGGTISISTKGKSDFVYDRIHIRNDTDLLSKNFPLVDSLSYIKHGVVDAEPDIFNYNFCGYSGQFVLDNNFNVVFTNNSNGLRVIANKQDRSFIVKDLKGRSYYFDSEDVEMTFKKVRNYGYYFYVNEYVNNGPWWDDPNELDPIPTAFFLSRIELENNQGDIVFEYENELARYITRMSGSISNRIQTTPPPHCAQNASNEWEDPNGTAFVRNRINNETLRLKSISYEAHNDSIKIVFNALVERADLKGTKRLDAIDLLVNNKKINIWKLSYDYFTSTLIKQEEITGNDLHKRLKLKEIQKFDGSKEEVEPPYEFIYSGEPESSDQTLKMPYRTSFDGYDHWGYCNSKVVSESNADMPSKLFPDVSYSNFKQDEFICVDTISGNDINHTGFIQGWGTDMFDEFYNERGNREPDAISVKTYSLEKIYYPTGGFTSFTYELHEFGLGYEKVGGLRIQKQISFDGTAETLEKTYSYSLPIFGLEPSYIKARIKPRINPIFCTAIPGIALCEEETIHHHGFILSTNSILMEHSTNTDYIGYLVVTEKLIASGQEKGKTIYTYRHPTNEELLNFDFTFGYTYSDISPHTKQSGIIFGKPQPVYPFSSGYIAPSYKRGLLSKVDHLNASGKHSRKTEYYYDFSNEKIIYGNEVHCEMPSQGHMWYISAYKLYGGKALQDSIVTTQYDVEGTSPITSIATKTYHTKYELPKKITEYGEDILTTEYVYPFEFKDQYHPGNVYNVMMTKSMIDSPLEITKRSNGLVTTSSSFKYAFVHYAPTTIKPVVLYQLENSTPLNSFNPVSWNSQTASFNRDEHYYEATNFTEYDVYSRLLEFQDSDDVLQSYIWPSRLKKYPVAFVKNASFDQIAYCSFEDSFIANGTTSQTIGNWHLWGGPSWLQTEISKTGLKGVYVNSTGSIQTSMELPADEYIISLYTKDPSSISFSPAAYKVTTKDTGDENWSLVQASLRLTSTQKISIDVKGYIDELRLFPASAQMNTYTFDHLSRITSECDINSNVIRYIYENDKLVKTIDNSGNIFKTFDYNYAQ